MPRSSAPKGRTICAASQANAVLPATSKTGITGAALTIALTSIDELKGRLKMLSSNHGKIAKIAGLVLAGGLVIGGLTLVPALAEDAKPRTETIEIRKVIHDGPGKPGDAQAVMQNCPGQAIAVSAEGGAGAKDPGRKDVAQIKLCLKAGTKAETASRLEEVIADLDKQGEMDAGVKAQLKAKLTAKVAELRAAN